VIAGAGAGVVQMGAMAAVLHIAPADARAGVTSAFFSACYLAMSVPVVVAGLTADRFGLDVVTWWYLAALAALVVAALLASQRRPTEATARSPLPADLRLATAD
jgi:MFS family permease